MNTDGRMLILSKIKLKYTTASLLKKNIPPQVHFAFCHEASGLESRKTPHKLFSLRERSKVSFSRNVDDKRKQYDREIFRN